MFLRVLHRDRPHPNPSERGVARGDRARMQSPRPKPTWKPSDGAQDEVAPIVPINPRPVDETELRHADGLRNERGALDAVAVRDFLLDRVRGRPGECSRNMVHPASGRGVAWCGTVRAQTPDQGNLRVKSFAARRGLSSESTAL